MEKNSNILNSNYFEVEKHKENNGNSQMSNIMNSDIQTNIVSFLSELNEPISKSKLTLFANELNEKKGLNSQEFDLIKNRIRSVKINYINEKKIAIRILGLNPQIGDQIMWFFNANSINDQNNYKNSQPDEYFRAVTISKYQGDDSAYENIEILPNSIKGRICDINYSSVCKSNESMLKDAHLITEETVKVSKSAYVISN
jgi:hypothetical protein